jgi:16S rRNA (cytosine1402-N4)-methyltransferase
MTAAVAPAPHEPVLLEEVVAGLAVQPGSTLVDGTFGAGGYTKALLGAGAGRVIAFDRDPTAIAEGASLVPDPRLRLVQERFSRMDRAMGLRSTSASRPCSSTAPSAASLSPRTARSTCG